MSRDDPADEIPNVIVMVHEAVPVDRLPWPFFVGEGGFGEIGDNVDLAFDEPGDRFKPSLRGLDDAHGVFRGDILRNVFLQIGVGPSQCRQNEGFGSRDEVGPVEFGGDVHGKPAAGERLRGIFRIRRGREKVATEGDEDFGLSRMHGLDPTHGVMATLGGGLKVADLCETIQKFEGGVFGDAHRAITLHVAMAPDGASACAGFPDIAAQQEQVDDLLHVGHRVFMLGHTHGPRADEALGLHDNIGGLLDVFPRNAAAFLNFLP